MTRRPGLGDALLVLLLEQEGDNASGLRGLLDELGVPTTGTEDSQVVTQLLRVELSLVEVVDHHKVEGGSSGLHLQGQVAPQADYTLHWPAAAVDLQTRLRPALTVGYCFSLVQPVIVSFGQDAI